MHENGMKIKMRMKREMKMKWYGKCKDEACTFIVPLQSTLRFDQLGTYNIEFDQYSRTDSLWGFNDFTLRLTESITK